MLNRLKFAMASLVLAVLSLSLSACGGGGGLDDGEDGGDGGAARTQWDAFDWDEAQWE